MISDWFLASICLLACLSLVVPGLQDKVINLNVSSIDVQISRLLLTSQLNPHFMTLYMTSMNGSGHAVQVYVYLSWYQSPISCVTCFCHVLGPIIWLLSGQVPVSCFSELDTWFSLGVTEISQEKYRTMLVVVLYNDEADSFFEEIYLKMQSESYFSLIKINS